MIFSNTSHYQTKVNTNIFNISNILIICFYFVGIGQVVPVNSIVLIHYVAYVSNFHEPFDVTYLQSKRPKRFTLGIGEILPGLEIGIKTMTMGENAKFIVKPELAYRELGCPPRIPPNATILFDVHLISYLSPENCLSFDEENQDPENFTKTFTRVKKLHIEGNEQFKLKNFEKAISKYVIAKELLHLVRSNSDYEEIEIMKYLSKIYINLSVCYIKQCAFTKVCRMGLEAMKYSERFSKHSAKLYFNWGKALRLLKNFREAKIKLQKSLKLEPYNETIQNEMAKLEKDKKFNYNIEMFTLNDNSNTDNENLPPDFWEVFNTHLIEFIDSTDDILTVTVNNQDDIEIVKRKASSYGLLTHVITKADKSTNCIAIQKTEE